MWNRWKKKISGLFENEPLDEEITNKKQNMNQNVHTKMMYQYPKNNTFRFPVIPDETTKKITSNMPAYQRKRKSNTRREDNQLNKGYNKSFQPSKVASPIYGYQKRLKEKDIENIPAFMRKQKSKEYQPVQNEINKESLTIKTKEAINVELTNDVTNKNKEVSGNKLETSIEKTSTSSDDLRTSINVPSSYNKKTLTEKVHSRKRRDSNVLDLKKDTIKKEPYNLLMTEKDKRDSETSTVQQQKNGINDEQKMNRPPHYLLNDPKQTGNENKLWLKSQQQLLERTLTHFNVRAKVVKATQGPSVTRFEVQPELGVKVSKVRNLSDDIKLNMAAKDIRIEAPIPGKNTIGIEVPNPKPQMVGLQEILETDSFKHSKSPLTIALGLTIEGLPLITNIAKMPHGLIAGATGSGKSVCINTILISLLYKSHYEEVKFLLIDPKMVELAPYNGIPHLVSPVITDVKAATAALKWAVKEMEERYERFVQVGVRDIERYNEEINKKNLSFEKMPYIVIVIDELADLMMVSPQDVEDAICRIAQKARACGIHLLLATQRPSVDVITGLIKANIPTRIAFSVSSQVDSRTIIDSNGAEKLLGRGDMLFVENGSGKSLRLQGPFVSDDEIERVTGYLRAIAQPTYLFQQQQLLKEITMDEEDDVILEDVIEFVLKQNNASTSLLQRQFRIGYNRAARLIDTLQNRGIVSEQNGTKPREVLISTSQMEEKLPN